MCHCFIWCIMFFISRYKGSIIRQILQSTLISHHTSSLWWCWFSAAYKMSKRKMDCFVSHEGVPSKYMGIMPKKGRIHFNVWRRPSRFPPTLPRALSNYLSLWKQCLTESWSVLSDHKCWCRYWRSKVHAIPFVQSTVGTISHSDAWVISLYCWVLAYGGWWMIDEDLFLSPC